MIPYHLKQKLKWNSGSVQSTNLRNSIYQFCDITDMIEQLVGHISNEWIAHFGKILHILAQLWRRRLLQEDVLNNAKGEHVLNNGQCGIVASTSEPFKSSSFNQSPLNPLDPKWSTTLSTQLWIESFGKLSRIWITISFRHAYNIISFSSVCRPRQFCVCNSTKVHNWVQLWVYCLPCGLCFWTTPWPALQKGLHNII